MSVGEILRRTRLHYGKTLDEVERALRIKQSQIVAIENDSTEELPGKVYAIGFVRAYSDFFALNTPRILEQFERQVNSKVADPSLAFPSVAKDGKAPSLVTIMLSLAFLVLGGISLSHFSTSVRDDTVDMPEKTAQRIPDVPMQIAGKSRDIPSIREFEKRFADDLNRLAPASGAAKEVPEQIRSQMPERGVIHIDVLSDAEAKIYDADGMLIISKSFEKGEKFFVPDDREDLKIKVEPRDAIQIYLDGQRVIMPQGLSEVVLLNASFLKPYAISNKTLNITEQ